MGQFLFSKLRTNSTRERTGTPLGPLAIHDLFSSIQATPAISRWIQGVSSTNSFRNIAAGYRSPPHPAAGTHSGVSDRTTRSLPPPRRPPPASVPHPRLEPSKHVR